MIRHVIGRAEQVLAEAALDGIVVRADIGAALSHEAVRHQLASGRLVPIGRGVWKLRDHPWDVRCERRAALALAGSGSALGLRTAANLFGWYRYRKFAEVEVVVARGFDQRSRIGRVVQSRRLPPHHVTVVDGFPVTTPARTFFDLCGDPDPGLRRRGGHPIHERNMQRVYDDIVARRGVSFAHESAVLLVMAKRGRAGTRLVRGILERCGPAYTPTQSEAESLFVELIGACGLPDPKRQVPIVGADGWIGTVDFLWPDALHIVEIDSSWHDGHAEREADLERDQRLNEAGYTVARYRYREMIVSPAAIARELGVAVRPGATTATPRTEVDRG
jgi:very-short-patch-repair endonuclease